MFWGEINCLGSRRDAGNLVYREQLERGPAVAFKAASLIFPPDVTPPGKGIQRTRQGAQEGSDPGTGSAVDAWGGLRMLSPCHWLVLSPGLSPPTRMF